MRPRRLSSRLIVAAVGILVLIALYDPLELDDLPNSLGGARTAVVLWMVVGAIWCGAMLRIEAVYSWAQRHRGGLLRLLRHSAVYYGPILVALFYLMWVLGRLWLGFWPRAIPMHDPKGIPPCAVVHLLICGWFWLWPVAVFLPIGRFIHARLTHRRHASEHLFELTSTLLLIAVSAWWLVTDPHQLVRWFLD